MSIKKNKEKIDFFLKNSFLEFKKMLQPKQINTINEAIDISLKKNPTMWFWKKKPNVNCNLLLTETTHDTIILNEEILTLLENVMDGTFCFEETSIQITEPSEISKPTNWHRDVSHLNGEFQKLLYPQLIIYLTNVDENTHCFSLSPEPQGNQISSTEIQLQKHGVYNFYGQAGDAILLNSNCLHGLTLRKTKIERRILQIYYSHPSSPEVGDNTIIPPRLWRDNPDPRIRRFFSKHNSYSKLVNQAMGLEIK